MKFESGAFLNYTRSTRLLEGYRGKVTIKPSVDVRTTTRYGRIKDHRNISGTVYVTLESPALVKEKDSDRYDNQTDICVDIVNIRRAKKLHSNSLEPRDLYPTPVLSGRRIGHLPGTEPKTLYPRKKRKPMRKIFPI